MKKLLIGVAALSILLASGCSNEDEKVVESPVPVAEEVDQVDQAVETNVDAEEINADTEEVNVDTLTEVQNLLDLNAGFFAAKDVEGYVSTLASETINEYTVLELEEFFNNFNATISIENVEIVEETEDRVRVSIEQTTIYSDAPEGMSGDSISTVIHTLLREDGALKFLSTEVVDTQPYNQ